MDLAQLNSDLREVRKGLRKAGVYSKTIQGITTRAQKSGRRQTGDYQSNRSSRWNLDPRDPQYGTEEECKVIELRLLGMMCEFVNAPVLSEPTTGIISKYLGREPVIGSYRDALTLERLDYKHFEAEALQPKRGRSVFHIGHDDPTAVPKHCVANVSWRTHRSNLIQGDMTLREARTKLVELIGRYFQLGEVTIHPDEIA
ncbi:hypothetical protein [Micromonospora endophytica]|uniref:hypothetical protein n=1 Tax=Micromonospora endophytica TaxID=515350 RepID=UPI0011B42D3C|nr:hypothetical protein [Micromonospora endophytica]BCJ58998.1 hypothetical protein Jiend_24200 [Micromonospora endophytica]